jgi:tripartite-type tricarboxylate transporter receptor subunit TctC
MQKEIAKAVTSQKVKDVFGAAGVRPIANTPAEFSTLVQNETKLWTDVIQRAKIKQE